MWYLFFPSPEEIQRRATLLIFEANYKGLEKLQKKLANYIAKKNKKKSADLEKYKDLLEEITEFI